MRIPDKHINDFKSMPVGGKIVIPWGDIAHKDEVKPRTLRDGPAERRLWEVTPSDTGVEIKRVK